MSGRLKRWMKLAAAAIVLVLVIGYAALQISFRSWRAAQDARIRAGTRVISLERGELEYASVGDAGSVVLFFHGAMGGADQPLRLEGFRVLTPSRPGYMGTALAVGRTLPEAASSCAEFLDSLGVERVSVMGLSAGGPTALEFASRHPQRVSALVLVSAISKERPRPVPERGRLARATDLLMGEGAADWLLSRLLRLFPELMISDPESEYLSTSDLELMQSSPDTLAHMAEVFSHKFAFNARRYPGFVNDRRLYGRMGEPDLPITAPTLVIHGTADRDVSFDHAESIVRRIPGAVLFPLEGVGHAAFYLHFDKIQSRMAEFLDAGASGHGTGVEWEGDHPRLNR